MSQIHDAENVTRLSHPTRFGALPPEGYVGAPVVREFFGGISITTLWRLLKLGVIPAPDISEGKIRLWDVAKLRAARVGKPGSRRKTRPEAASK